MTFDDHTIRPLLELTRRLLEKIPLAEALQAVTDTALRLLPAQHASVRVLDESGTRLLSGARSGKGSEHAPLDFQPGEGIVGWVVTNGASARIADTSRDQRFKPASGRQGFSIRSILDVPLWSAGKVVGVLGVTSPEPNAFTEDDEMLALLLANCAAPSIEKARLEYLSITDHHTMAYNQRLLFPRLREEIERARRHGTPLSVLLMDLDHFKRVNDAYGHAAGDFVLQCFADRARGSVRLSDVLIRRGGEEFLLIMPDMPRQLAGLVAERIRHSMSESPLVLGEDVEVIQTVSIGTASWNGQESAEELERRADAAMYTAKQQGRNRVVLAPDIIPTGLANEHEIPCPRRECGGILIEETSKDGDRRYRCNNPSCNSIIKHLS
jgi:diguanylate cyclase (GGDEF)-like protein